MAYKIKENNIEKEYRSRPTKRGDLLAAAREIIAEKAEPKIEAARAATEEAWHRFYKEAMPQKIQESIRMIQSVDPKFLREESVLPISVKSKYGNYEHWHWCPVNTPFVDGFDSQYSRRDREVLLKLSPIYQEVHDNGQEYVRLLEERQRLFTEVEAQLVHLTTTEKLAEAWPEVHERYQKMYPDERSKTKCALAIVPKVKAELDKFPDGNPDKPKTLGKELRAKKAQTKE